MPLMPDKKYEAAPLPADVAKVFILGGKVKGATHPGSIFTLNVPADFANKNDCSDHYTYKVRFKPATGSFPDSWMVSLLNGPDNWRNYVYIGMLNPETGEFRTTKRSKAGDDAWSVRFVRRIFAALWEKGSSFSKLHEAGFDLLHAGRCGLCGKRLTTPESIERGIGPRCWAKLGGI
jgi:hypothetical protein